MKIGKIGITVHPAGWLLLLGTGLWCYNTWSLWPLLYLIIFLAILIPLCIGMHYWNEKQNKKMLEDFPHDPYIQKKYGRK